MGGRVPKPRHFRRNGNSWPSPISDEVGVCRKSLWVPPPQAIIMKIGYSYDNDG